MPRCEAILKQLDAGVPPFELEDDVDLEWTRACFHLFGEFVQLKLKEPSALKGAVAAILAFLKSSDDGEDFAPYQTLVKLYTALGDTQNAYTLVQNTADAFGDEPFFAEILSTKAYRAWSAKA